MKARFILIFLFAEVISGLAQQPRPNRCAMQENLQALKAADPGLEARMQLIEAQTQNYLATPHNEKTSSVTYVPVVFHVVYNTTAENLPDVIIREQVAVLNADYSRMNSDTGNVPAVWKSIAANTNIQFCLAYYDTLGNPTNGIIHKQTSVTSFSTSPSDNKVKFTSQGGDNAWDRTKYLNIWVCNMGMGVLGYAQMPGGPAATDGVVINYWAVGKTGATPPYNLGRTTTHEVGHWFNLYHTWGDDFGACTGTDYVADTPNEADANYSNYAPGTVMTDACSSTAPGYMWQNYLDYTDDAGMCIFTAGQAARMQACLNTTRSSILTAVTECGALGIAPLNAPSPFSVYPSPSDGFVHISAPGQNGKAEFSFFDLSGRQVLKLSRELNDGQCDLDAADLADGLYILQVQINGQTPFSQKLSIRH